MNSPAPDSKERHRAASAPVLAPATAPEFRMNLAEAPARDPNDEGVTRRNRRKDGIIAFLISVAVQCAILLLLSRLFSATLQDRPPELVAIAAPPTPDPPVPTKEKVPPDFATPTIPSLKVLSLFTANTTSPVSVPTFNGLLPEALAPGLALETGFGKGTSYSGDNWVSTLPPGMRSRCSFIERMNRLKVGGGDARCEDAVDRALDWLGKNQNEDGSWGKSYPVAMTGLALLSFLGHCETPDSLKFGESVVGAATYLMDVAMKNEGKLVSPGGKLAYEHAIATYALCELYTLSQNGHRQIPDLAKRIQSAMDSLIRGQNANGSWNYNYQKGRSDTSVTGWQMQALHAARLTELQIPSLAYSYDRGVVFLEKIQGENGGFRYTDDSGDGSITLTGVGVLGLQFGGKSNSRPARSGIDYIFSRHPSLSYDGINFYEWYYSTQACFQAGGETWEQWNRMFLDPILEAQDDSGRWPPERGNQTNSQSRGDGDVYRTCLATLMLEVFYRYLPTGEKLRRD